MHMNGCGTKNRKINKLNIKILKVLILKCMMYDDYAWTN